MNTLDLAGRWTYRLDPEDRGANEHWYEDRFNAPLHLPGSLQAQGIGDDVTLESAWVGNIVDRSLFDDPRYAPYREPDNIKYPCWLQPDKVYTGVAWYQREIVIPPEWEEQRVTLHLERAHWKTTVWLDGRLCGSEDSLSTPHRYELGRNLAPGTHLLTIAVDNRMIVEVGVNAHSVSDHTQTNWNGIIGAMRLEAGSPVWMNRVRIFPEIETRAFTVKVDFAGALGRPGAGRLTVTAHSLDDRDEPHAPTAQTDFTFAALGGLAEPDLSTVGGHVDVTLPLGDRARLWDEFNPARYRLEIALETIVDGITHVDRRSEITGLRAVSVQGTQLAVNGRPIFLRGTLECCIFPLTGYPATDVESWRRIFRICREHGLNHMRFHSWCPPEAAFAAADEAGFYLQVECPSWANQGAAIGEGRPLDDWLYREAGRIIATYGNHPSFIMMAYGNEPAGRIEEFLSTWVTYWQTRDPRRLYTGGAGWPQLDVNDYQNIPEPRIQRWGEGLNSRINGRAPETRADYSDYVNQSQKPIISHEIGQWCVYPNFAEMPKYTGVLKPKNFEIFQEFLAAGQMADQAEDFLQASGKLQTLCYKEEIEAALRTPGFGGFQLLDLHDFPGQGTALVGVLDPFWDEKGYVTPAEFSRFCNSVVPLALLEKRYWHSDEALTFDVRIANFSAGPLQNARLEWRVIVDGADSEIRGTLSIDDIEIGNTQTVGPIQAPPADLPAPCRVTLAVGIVSDHAPRAENDWDLWVYPPEVAESGPPDLLECTHLDAAARARLAEGGVVLLCPPPEEQYAPSTVGFSCAFWNTAWTSGQEPHTLGILCDPGHPVFTDFPTESHSNWQWWELINGSAAMVLDGMPPGLRPLVQVIDTWFEARRLGLLLEARVGGGRLMICAMNLTAELETRPVARQLRASLLRYLASEEFSPDVELEYGELDSLFKVAAQT